MKIDTIVFLGPTLSLSEARKVFPEACYHGPAQRGDIFRVLRLKPKKIVLIDGYFETVPSVWHKEILFAMEKGVIVYGASSMGALRAAELADFGMRGVGRIFQDYHNSILNEDDAVAVLHTACDGHYIQTSEALVDLRATVEKYCSAEPIPERQQEKMLDGATNWFYPERCVECFKEEGPFYQWIQKNGLVRQKALDALEALSLARNSKSITHPFEEVPKTTYLCFLIRQLNVSPFRLSYDWLPKEEQDLILEAQSDQVFFKVLRELALALSIAYDLARSHPHEGDIPSLQGLPDSPWTNLIKTTLENHEDESVLNEIYLWISEKLKTDSSAIKKIERYYNFLAALHGVEFDEPILQEKTLHALSHFAVVFFGIDHFLEDWPYIYDRSRCSPHFRFKFSDHENFMRAVAYTIEMNVVQDNLVMSVMRYYDFINCVPSFYYSTNELESVNWLIPAQQLIRASSTFRRFFAARL